MDKRKKRSADLDGTRPVAFGPRQMERENAVAIFRLYTLGIERDGKRQGAVERAKCALAPVHAGASGIGYGFLTRDPNGVFLGLDLEAVFVDPGQFDDGQNVVALLAHVDRRKRPSAGGLIVQPIARPPTFNRPLQMKKRLERIGKGCD